MSLLQTLIDVASVTDPRQAAALKILQRNVMDANEQDIADAALQVANNGGVVPTEVPDKRGLIGSALEGLGILGPAGNRPLSQREAIGANLGHMMFQAHEEEAKQRDLQNHIARLNLLASLGGKFGPGAVSTVAPGLGEDPNLPFGMAGFSDMEMRQKNYQLKQRELGDTEELNRAKIGALNAKESGGVDPSKALGFASKVMSTTKSIGGADLAALEKQIVALDKQIREAKANGEDTKALEDDLVQHVNARNDLIDHIQQNILGLPGSLRLEGSGSPLLSSIRGKRPAAEARSQSEYKKNAPWGLGWADFGGWNPQLPPIPFDALKDVAPPSAEERALGTPQEWALNGVRKPPTSEEIAPPKRKKTPTPRGPKPVVTPRP